MNKKIAKLAGIGNIGKNGFFVSPTYGIKIVLSSILTTAPLEFDREYQIDICQNCNICENKDFISSLLYCPYGKDKSKD
jgi:epoxyqueuosine reductase QueG